MQSPDYGRLAAELDKKGLIFNITFDYKVSAKIVVLRHLHYRKFAMGVEYPYNQFFTSADVENFFTRETGKELGPIFNFYLNTTSEIEIDVYRSATDRYSMTVTNAPMTSLPLDIITDSGTIRTTMKATAEKPFVIESKTPPVIDPRGSYFRKIIFH